MGRADGAGEPRSPGAAPPTAAAGPTTLRRRLSALRSELAAQQEASSTSEHLLSDELTKRLQVRRSVGCLATRLTRTPGRRPSASR